MRDIILQKLLEAEGGYVSGGLLSSQCGVTRSAVWKYIISLREQGFEIEAATKKGYRLINVPNKLSAPVVQYLVKDTMWNGVKLFDVLPSTSTYLKNLEQLSEGMAVFANAQTNGRGRRGKAWHSPDEGNIYLSVCFRPSFSVSNYPILSLLAGLAVARTLSETCGLNCGIKWPNDVVVNGKKICGILAELAGELDAESYCIVGIGINMTNTKFPDSVSTPATSVFIESNRNVPENSVAAALLKNLEYEYRHIDTLPQRYRDYCLTLGKEVEVLSPRERFQAKALDICDDGSLVVLRDSKEIRVNSGEVSVRGIYGYI